MLDQNPNTTFKVVSLRPDVCEVGWSMPVYIPHVCEGNFIVNQVDFKVIGRYDRYKASMVEQTITLQRKRESLEDIMKRLARKNSFYFMTQNLELVSSQAEEVSISIEFEEFVSDIAPVIPPTYTLEQTDKTVFHWELQDG